MSQAEPIVPDPIHAAIDRHRDAARLWRAAVNIRDASYLDAPNEMDDLERQARLDAAVANARLPTIDAGLDLVGTEPTTVEGIMAGLEYARDLLLDGGHTMPQAIDWLGLLVGSLADAAGDLLAKYPKETTP